MHLLAAPIEQAEPVSLPDLTVRIAHLARLAEAAGRHNDIEAVSRYLNALQIVLTATAAALHCVW